MAEKAFDWTDVQARWPMSYNDFNINLDFPRGLCYIRCGEPFNRLTNMVLRDIYAAIRTQYVNFPPLVCFNSKTTIFQGDRLKTVNLMENFCPYTYNMIKNDLDLAQLGVTPATLRKGMRVLVHN